MVISLKWGKFQWVPPLGKELQVTNDCWEKENNPLMGMRPLLVFQCIVICLVTVWTQTTKADSAFLYTHMYVYVRVIIKIQLSTWEWGSIGGNQKRVAGGSGGRKEGRESDEILFKTYLKFKRGKLYYWWTFHPCRVQNNHQHHS